MKNSNPLFKMAPALLLVLSLLAFNFWVTFRTQEQLIDSQRWVRHTFEVLREPAKTTS